MADVLSAPEGRDLKKWFCGRRSTGTRQSRRRVDGLGQQWPGEWRRLVLLVAAREKSKAARRGSLDLEGALGLEGDLSSTVGGGGRSQSLRRGSNRENEDETMGRAWAAWMGGARKREEPET